VVSKFQIKVTPLIRTKFLPDEPIVVEVLSASDLNIKYLDCVDAYISSWLSVPIQNSVKFIPKVLIIAKSIPESLVAFDEYLVLIDPHDMPSAYVAQTARIVEARNSKADYVMTSDIDMLPLTVNFESALVSSENFNSSSFFILRDVLEPGQYPICYNLAKPVVWHTLLDFYGNSLTTPEILKKILDEHGGISSYSGLHGGKGWTIDQQTLWKLVQLEPTSIVIKSFVDSQTAHRRLDRIHHRGFIKWLILPLVLIGYYHDYHIHHPIKLNIKYIRLVLRLRNLRFGIRRHP
jgi:hypothetical protein